MTNKIINIIIRFLLILGIMIPIFVIDLLPSDVSNFEFVLQNILTVISILLGFIFALLGILIGIVNSKVMLRIKEARLGERLMLYIEISLISGFLSVILSIALGTFYNEVNYTLLQLVIFDLWIYANIVFSIVSAVLMYIMILILKNMLQKEEIKVVKPNLSNFYKNNSKSTKK